MDPSVEGVPIPLHLEGARADLPEGAATLIDLAAKWMRDEGLLGKLSGATLEFALDENGKVRAWFSKSKGGRPELLPTAIDPP